MAQKTGAKPQLTEKKLVKIKQALVAWPLSAGYDTNLWTLVRVAAVIQKKVHVSYSQSHVWYLLHSLGWSS